MPPQLQGATTGLLLGGKHVRDEACHHPQFGGTTVTPLTVVFLLWGVAGGCLTESTSSLEQKKQTQRRIFMVLPKKPTWKTGLASSM